MTTAKKSVENIFENFTAPEIKTDLACGTRIRYGSAVPVPVDLRSPQSSMPRGFFFLPIDR